MRICETLVISKQVLIKHYDCYHVAVPTPQCITPPAVRPTCISNAAQGYRLELTSAVHASVQRKTKNSNLLAPAYDPPHPCELLSQPA